jgi:ABC-type branched-subunit amino acid transport system substrate-binding protein
MSQRSRNVAALLISVALLGTGCSRGSDETESGASTTAPSGDAPSGSRLDDGGFGGIEQVCSDGDGAGATEIGVTDDSIQIGTVTDKGFAGRPGLTAEMLDAAVAFAAWCNEHGGINGRELVIADRDAAIVDYNGQVVEGCSEDLAFVGGGAALDDADNGGRVDCGLPNLPAYVVSQTAREGGVEELQVQAVPNPPTEMNAGIYQQVAEQYPELLDGFGVMTSQFGSTQALRDETVVAAESAGFSVVYSDEFAATGEANWRPFAEEMRSSGVKAFEFIGDPAFMTQLLQAMDEAGYQPELILLQANLYDATFVELAGARDNVRVRTSFTPMELASENPATADYLELMERYNPGGIVALLGMQATSALLLFAQAATACGSELTRACLVEQAAQVEEWTGGGLHAPTSPSDSTPSTCFALLGLGAEEFVLDEELTAPTDGIFNCDQDNLVEVG